MKKSRNKGQAKISESTVCKSGFQIGLNYMHVSILAGSRVSWTLGSPTTDLANPLEHIEPIKQRSFSKPDLGVKRSSDSDIASQNILHSKTGLPSKRFSQPDLINRRPLELDVIDIQSKKDKHDVKENLKKFETMKSVAEMDKVNRSDKQLMNISKMKLNNGKSKASAADKTIEAKPYLVLYKADPNYSVKEIAFTEKETLKPSAKYDVKISNPKLSSAPIEINRSKLIDTDNRSAVSDSGLGSEYSAWTMKTESHSEFSTQGLRTEEVSDEKSPHSAKTKLFEIKTARPKSSRSRSETQSRGSKKGFIGVKKTRSEKRGNHGERTA